MMSLSELTADAPSMKKTVPAVLATTVTICGASRLTNLIGSTDTDGLKMFVVEGANLGDEAFWATRHTSFPRAFTSHVCRIPEILVFDPGRVHTSPAR